VALGILSHYRLGNLLLIVGEFFAIKVGPDGIIDHLKARPVAKGYT